MKNSIYIVAFFAALLLPIMFATDNQWPQSRHGLHYDRFEHATWPRTRDSTMMTPISNEERKQKRAHPLQIAGSRLPDCSHACGSCSPCRLIIVGSMCASPSQAETCPISYRCMCKNKSYPVP